MKKALIIFIFGLLTPLAFSQDGDHIGGGYYTKTIEYNLLRPIIGYNYNSKSDVEKLFFGNYNAPVEFFYGSDGGVFSGFRIIRDTLKMSYFLEIKYVSNYREAASEASEKASIAFSMLEKTSQVDERTAYYFKEMNKLFKVESRSFKISDKFAEKLYNEMVSFIDNFKARGVPPFINGGYSVTFRTAVDDNELWTLKIHVPTGNAFKFAKICIKLLEEKDSKKLEESTYIKLLDDFKRE